MGTEESRTQRVLTDAAALGSAAASAAARRLTVALGGAERTRVIIVLAAILGLSGADAATVGASASELRSGLHITNTDIGLLVAVTLPRRRRCDVAVRRPGRPGDADGDARGDDRHLGRRDALERDGLGLHQLLWTRLFLGAVTAAAGPMVASLVGDWFGSWERGRIYGLILAGEYVGAGFGFAITGNVAALSWRAAFVILALPAFALALVVWRLREPERGGKGVLASDKGPPAAELSAQAHDTSQTTDAQRLARERGHRARPRARVGPSEARRMNLIRATRYVLRVRTNLILIAASACGYYFLAGLQTFGLEFSREQYGIDQALASLLLLVVGVGSLAGVLIGGSLGDCLSARTAERPVWTPSVAAAITTVLFVPAIFTRDALTACPTSSRQRSSSAPRIHRSTRRGSTSCRRSSGAAPRRCGRCSARSRWRSRRSSSAPSRTTSSAAAARGSNGRSSS